MIQYFDDMDLACVDGYSFRVDKKTGYYLSSKKINGKRIRLHIYIWEKYNGKIEKGYHIHHIDGNKYNNEIENLTKILEKDHLSYHARNLTEETKQKMRENLLIYAVPKSVHWHSTEEGKKWHSQHGKNVFGNLSYIKYHCTYCGKDFESRKRYREEDNRFCSNACKSNFRRKSGVDDIVKMCEVCGNEYKENKYRKTKKCSECKKCRN